jgi:hypothetical protein
MIMMMSILKLELVSADLVIHKLYTFLLTISTCSKSDPFSMHIVEKHHSFSNVLCFIHESTC